MIDIKLIRENPDLVKDNIRKKFQEEKLVLVDEVKKLDEDYRALRTTADELRSKRNSISKQIGALMGQGKKEEAEQIKAEVKEIGNKIEECEQQEPLLEEEIRKRMLVIPNIIDESVPIGVDDSQNVLSDDGACQKEHEVHFESSIFEQYFTFDIS